MIPFHAFSMTTFRFDRALAAAVSLLAAVTVAAVPRAAAAETNAPAPKPAAATPAPAKPGPGEIVVSGQTVALTNAASARNIRFQFDGIPYADVLERFAQMSGKPLLADTNVVGTLSYNDPNAYSFPEALETLNLILSMKGVMLLDAGTQLRLVPFKDIRSLPIPILRGTEPTADVRPGDIVSVVLDLQGLDAREVAESVTPMLSNAGSVAPLGRGRRLVITDRLSNIQRVRALLATLDSAAPAERQMRTFTLLNASGAIISDLLNRTFGIATAPKRTSYNPSSKVLEVLPPDPNDYVTAVYDEASRTLVLFGPEERLGLAEQLISKFEQKDGAGGDVRIYHPTTVKPEELANIIRQAVPAVAGPNETAAAAATKARVIPDATQNRLIVAAPLPGQLDQIETLIARIDKTALPNGTGAPFNAATPNRTASVQITRIFKPRASEVTNVASILTQALTRRAPNGSSATTASISVDPNSQSVVVSGTANDVQIASDIVSQLETGTSQPTPLQTRFIDTGSPEEAKRLLPLVEQLYRSQTAGGSSGSVAHAKIMADTEVGRLIVTASEDHLSRIEGLVRQLRSERAEPQPRHLRVFTLVHARPDAALASLQGLLNERLADRRFASVPKPSIVPDASNNRLLVTATDEQLREVEQIIAIVDAAPAQARREMVVIPVTTKPAAEILPLVNQLLAQLKSPNSEPPTLIPDPTGKQIIALATSNDIPRIRTLVQQFDASPAAAAPRQFRALESVSRPAAEIAPILQQLYSEQIKGLPEPAGGPASILAEPRQNRLMVSGSEKEIARVESILRQLDPAGSKSTRDETRVFKLRAASAADLAALVEKSVGASGHTIRVLLDARSNSLVISGDAAALQSASQIIQQLDSRPESGPREFRIFDLKSSDATTLTPTLTALFTEMLRDQRGADFVPTSKITPDTAGNRILVTGPREEIEQIASLVNRLDNAPQQSPGARVFKLSQSDATMLAPIVTSAMLRYDARGNPIRRVTVTADEKSNSLVVSGTRADLQDAESVIEKLDNEAGGGGSSSSSRDRVLRILDVKSDPDSVAAFATKAFAAQNPRLPNPVSITPDPAGKRLIVLAPTPLMAQVEQVVSSLDTKPEQASRELHPVELKSANAAEFLPRVQQIYTEQSQGKTLKPATLYADSSNARLLVLGTAEQAATIRQIAETVATAPRPPRETRTFDIGSTADAQRLLPIIQQLYTNQWKDRGDADPADAQMVADPRTGRIIVTGKPEHLKQIEVIIQQLGTSSSKPSSSTRETRIIDLTTASAVELSSTVRTLYLEEAKSRLGTLTPDTLITPDAGANRLILVGETNEISAIEDIVRKLDKVSNQSASTRVFKIKSAEPSKVAEILSTALVRYDAYGRPQKRTTVSVDSKTRTLIVTGDPKELQGVSLIIEQLDQSLGTQDGRAMKVLSLAQGRAVTLVPKLRQLLADRIKSQPELGTDETLILEEPDSNQLILAGSPSQLAAVEQIVNELQTAQGAQAARETRFFDLGSAAELERLQPLVQQLYRIRSTNNPSDRPDAVFIPDTKNARLIVTARTNHLTEISRILTQLQGDQPILTARETRVIDLTTANAAELSTTVRTLYQEQSKSRPGAPAADTLILPDPGANRLIVTAATNELSIVEDIIRKLDKASNQSASTRVFKVKSAEPSKVAEILSSTLVRFDAYGRPQKRVAVSVDSKTRTLIVTGDPKELTGVASIIEQLDQSLGTAADRRMKVVSITQGRASILVPRVRQLYADRIQGQPDLSAAEVLILEEPDSNQLVLAGSEPQLAVIEQIISELQAAQGAQAARETRFFDLGSSAELERLQPLVQQLYRIRSTNNPSDRPDAVFVPDTKNARLIVTARTNHLAEISRILTQLQGDEPTRIQRETRVIDLTTANAAELSGTVRTLYQEQAKSRPGAPASDTLILPDNGANRLIVTAATNELAIVEEIVRKLDKVSAQSASTRVVKIKSADPDKVAEILSSALVRYDAFGRPQKRVSVSVDSKTRTLIITTSDPKELQSASVIVEQLDQSLGTAADRSMRVIPLQSRRTSDISAKVRQLFQDQSRANPELGNGEALILDDSTSNQLVLAGTEPQLKALASIVQAFDTPEPGSNAVLQSVRISKGRADDIAAAVNRSMTNRPGYNPASRVVITAVPGANSLLLNGPTNAVQDVLRIVRELDADAPSTEIEVRIYKLENGSAKEVSTILLPILQSVSARRRFSRSSPDGESGGGGGGFVRQASVSIDDRSNSLVVTGTADHFAVIEKLLPTLDKAPDRAERDVQFVWLRKGRAFDIASQIEALFEDRPKRERPVVEPELSNNSITLIGRRSDLAQIQELVARLDQQGKDSSYVVRLRALDRVAADQMAKLLQGIYPQTTRSTLSIVDKVTPMEEGATNTTPGVSVAIDKQANALVLAGPVAEIERVERLITDLSFNFYGNEAEFRLFPLKDADPVIVAKTLTDVLRPEPIQLTPAQLQQLAGGVPPQQPPKITVVAEPRTRSVVVRARPTDFALLESLIKQLDDAGASAHTSFKVFPLAHAEPQKALALVQQMVAQLNATRPGDPVTVTVSPRDRGLLIVAREPVIQQVSKMIESIDQPSKNVEAEVRVFPLKRANATQLAVVLQGLLRPGPQGESTPEARELQEQVRRLNVRTADGKPAVLDLSQPIRVSADAAAGGGNRLLVTASSENLAALASVIDLLDTPAIVEGVRVRFIRLAHADATTTAATLTSLFTQGRALATGPSGPGAEPQSEAGKALVHPLTIATDLRSNTLILSGRAETIELALKVVADIDQPLERFTTDIRLFRLKHASALRLVPLLQSVFTEGPSVPGTEGLATQITRLRTLRDGGDPSKSTTAAKTRAAITLQADDLSNILLVAARADMVPLIEEVVNQLDIPSASGLETVRVYPLQFADPGAIQKILADLFTGPRSNNLRNEDKPVITVDARSSSLIVAGNSKSFAVLEGLLRQLDQKLSFDLREIRIIPLEHADAGVVSTALQKLMDARVTQRATLNAGSADALKVVILSDTRSNALLVGGGKEAFELVESLAKQLDQASPALAGRIRVIPVQHADARILATTLTGLFTQRYAAAPGSDLQRQKPIILPDPRANVLLVAASQDDNGAVDDLLAKLDVKLENPALSLTVIPLKRNNAARVASLIQASFAARLRAQALPGQPPLPSQQVDVQPEPLNNALVVSASKENLELVQGLVAKLDAEPTIPGGVFEMFTLQYADAQRVATLLRSLVDQGLYRPGLPVGADPKARSSENILSTSVDSRSNTLIVSASPENLTIVKSVIQKLDNKDVAATADVKLYQLRHARASSLATILDQFFRAKRTADSITVNANERILPVTVLPDDRVNTLLVTGGKDAFDLVDRLLPQLDGEGTFSRLNFRVFPLQKATATKLQVTLQGILANRPPKVKGEPVDPITVTADAWVNALLVGATVDDMDTVASLIKQLDAEPTDTGLSIHVFPLAKADARRVATTVQGLFREAGPNQLLPVTVNADDRINALVVSCGETDARRIAELVRQLDTDQVARVAEIKVFPLEHARAETLSSILTAALNSKPTPLTEQNPNAQSVLQFITRTDEGQELVSAALKEAVLITPDLRMNSLIVSGPVEYMGLLEQIIHRLDAASPQQAKIKVFSLQNADARQMGELLTQLFRMTQTTAANQRSIQYTLVRSRTSPEGNILPEDEPLASATLGTAEANALTVTVDPRTNSLLVGGTDHYVTLVSQIIESLDSSAAAERTSRVVRLKNSQAPEVATAIRNFLDQERQRLVATLGADAVGTAQRMLEHEVAVVPEPNSNTLLVSANRRYFDEITGIIQELDSAQPQVLIQVVLAEVTLDSLGELGIEWKHGGSKGGVDYKTGTDFGIPTQLSTLGGFGTTASSSDFNFVLRALKTDGRLEVLSRPQIVTADNKPASINIGQRIPLITDSRVTPQNDTINSFRYEDVGVNLTVTPKISRDGFVKMELGTTNSAISSSTVEINRSATVPIINQRRANTTVSAQSGQTIIIGGLISTTDDRRVKKMPVLGEIPYLGVLFRSTRNTRERKELLIFLTPIVIANTQEKVALDDPQKLTDDIIRNSRFRKEFKPDEMQRIVIDPILPPDLAPTNSVQRSRRTTRPSP